MTEAVIYRNQSIDLQSKSMNWFLCVRDLCHEIVNEQNKNMRYFPDYGKKNEEPAFFMTY